MQMGQPAHTTIAQHGMFVSMLTKKLHDMRVLCAYYGQLTVGTRKQIRLQSA